MPLSVDDVKSGIDENRSFAEDQVSNISDLVTEAQNALRANQAIWGTLPGAATLPGDPSIDGVPAAPTMAAPPAITRPTAPSTPSLQTISFDAPSDPGEFTEVLSALAAPAYPTAVQNFGETAPSVTLPTAPSDTIGDFNEAAPGSTAIVIPDSPTTTIPEFTATLRPEPTIDTTQLLAAFDNALQNAASTTRADLVTVVNTVRDQLVPGYTSKVASIQTKLELLMGGEGIYSPGVEDAIYERNRSKVNAETTRVQQDALLTAARRGFTLPTGALMSAMQQARQGGADNNAAASRDIAIKQAELQQDNMKFALSQLAVYDKLMVDASLGYLQSYIAMRGHNVELAKATADALRAANQQLVDIYTMSIKTFEAQANVYEAQIRGALAAVDVFKAKIEAEKAKADIDVARVRAYEARVQAYGARVTAYGKRLEAVTSLAGLEKIKIDAFTAKVGAYSAQVQAKAAEWQGYSAAMQGQRAAADAYSAKAQAYVAKVDGFKAKVQAEGERIRALGITNESQLKAFEAGLRANAADLDAQKAVSTATIEQNRNLIAGYDSASRAILAKANLELEVYRTKSLKEMERYKTDVERYLREAQITSSANIAAANAHMTGAHTYATMVSGAMSGVTGILQASAS